MANRVWKIPLEECEAVSRKNGRKIYLPRHLSVKEGIASTAIPILIAYAVVMIRISILACQIYDAYPESITLPVNFGFSTRTFATGIFVVMMALIQLYLIYLDLTRRSIAKTLLLIPALFFALCYTVLTPLV